jgi:hypothetical protein
MAVARSSEMSISVDWTTGSHEPKDRNLISGRAKYHDALLTAATQMLPSSALWTPHGGNTVVKVSSLTSILSTQPLWISCVYLQTFRISCWNYESSEICRDSLGEGRAAQDGGSRFLLNSCNSLPNCTASYQIRSKIWHIYLYFSAVIFLMRYHVSLLPVLYYSVLFQKLNLNILQNLTL